VDLPNEARLAWLLATSARLLESGAEPVRGLVEPTAELFPERVDGRPSSVDALFRRTLAHAGLSDVAVATSVVTPDGAVAGGCSSGACGAPAPSDGAAGALEVRAGGYAVSLPLGLSASPPLLGAHLARLVAGIFLHEADVMHAFDPREIDGAIDVTATLLGFGVMITNGSHVAQKGCGGVRIVQGTTLTVAEAGVALAIFAALFGADARAARRHLDPTPREAFTEGLAWARANASTVRLVRDAPRAIEEGAYRLRPARGLLARVLGLGRGRQRAVDALDVDDEALARELARARLARGGGGPRPIDPARAARLARARAIVDEAMGND
jgi:hypothetical protein